MEHSENSVRAMGFCGVATAAVMIAADVILLASPASGTNVDTYALISRFPDWRLLAGHYLGILALPFYLIGFRHLHEALQPAGRWLSFPVTVLMSYATAVSVFFHGSFAAPALIRRAADAADPATRGLLEGIERQLLGFAKPVQAVLLACMVIATVWLAVAILSGKTRYPKWFAAVNPFLIQLIITGAAAFVPAVKAYVLPAALNVSLLVFFLVSVAIRWKERLA